MAVAASGNRPILVPLGLLRRDEIGEREHVDLHRRARASRQRQCRTPAPEGVKGGDAPHPGHEVYAEARNVRLPATEVHGVPALEVPRLERRHGDDARLEIGHRVAQALQVPGIGDDRQIGDAAKLRSAVQDAGLAAHQQRANPVRPHHRKDFANRARDQACLRGPGRSATSARSPPSARRA